MRAHAALLLLLLLACGCATAPRTPESAQAPHGVIGVRDAHLDPAFWIERAPKGDAVVMTETQIAAQNERVTRLDGSVHDIERLPAILAGQQIRALVAGLSSRPRAALYDASGIEIPAPQLDALERNVNLAHLAESQRTRYGMIVRRADLRTFPTRLRVFSRRGDADIDRFQESALFPGTPVAILHESADGEWLFVISSTYAAWVEKQHVAEGDGEQIFAYTRRTPHVIVTGASVRTVFTPERPELSELQLDMGVRAPLLAEWPPDKAVNGQHPYTARVIELPLRRADGSLEFAPALLPKAAEASAERLPLSQKNLVRQSFKFLGERYGWGHSYNARDCSGFVSEVYRSFGVLLPRNTRDQARSPALNRIAFTPADDRATRVAVLGSLQIGDLIYIPRHVMMVIGRDAGAHYVIHDTTGISYRDRDGEVRRVHLNGVSVTPLEPLLVGDKPLVDAIESIVRIRP